MYTAFKQKFDPFAGRKSVGYLPLVFLGLLVGLSVVIFSWPLSVLTVAAPVVLFVFFIRPEYGLYLFFFTIIMMTEYFPVNDPGSKAFVFQDIDLVHGLPPTLILSLLMMFSVYFFRLYIVEKKDSRIPIKYLAIFGGILLIAALNGLRNGWDPMELRVDLMQILFPALCFYLCINVLDQEAKISRMLWFVFIASILKAIILGIYYLMGRGIQYSSNFMAVTYDPSDLLAFATILLVLFALMTRRGNSSRQVFSILALMVPLVFVVIFSFRRSIWGGLLLSFGIYFLLHPAIPKKTIAKKALLFSGILLLLVNLVAFWQPTISSHVIERFYSAFDTKNDSNQHHYLESVLTLSELAYQAPVLGLGLGSHHKPVRGIDWAPSDQPTAVVHNTWIYIWMKTGLFGLGFMLWLSYRYFKKIYNFTKASADMRHPHLFALISSAGIWLTLSLTSPLLAYYHRSFLIALFAAIVISSINILAIPNATKTMNYQQLNRF